MKAITICSSAAFYEHANQIADLLEANGFKAVVPATAVKMRASGNFDVEAVKTWYKNPADYDKKAALMRGHFEAVAAGDAILVINDEKRGIEGYIGPNVLMEMGLAFYLKKPIYVLNSVGKDMPFIEEINGMNSIFINGDLNQIKLPA